MVAAIARAAATFIASLISLARTSSFNSVRRPETGEVIDLTRYYGAWVTPYAAPVPFLR